MENHLAVLDEVLGQVRAGGGERYVDRHRERGKLLPRQRIELCLDQDGPFFELQPLVGLGTEYQVGGGVVSGIGVVEDVECVLVAHDPTVRGGAMNPHTLGKIMRAFDIAAENRMPLLLFVESGGADLPAQAQMFIPGGRIFRDITRLSAAGVPTIALVFGNSTAGGAYLPAMCDITIFVRDRAKVFLGGPPLVQMATGERSTDEELGGADMHSRTSGLSDELALDELDAIRLGRAAVRRLHWRKRGPGPTERPAPPRLPLEDLLGIVPADLRTPFDPREILWRILDDSSYDEFKPLYGSSLTTGWGSLHGFPLGILANTQGVLFSHEAQKATHFIQLANQRDLPLLFIHNTTGFMVGKEYEQGGIIKDGAKMINAVSNSGVPHIGLIVGASYGAANYAMAGRSYRPRFLFSWPTARSAVMGPEQLAGVLSLVAQNSAQARGLPFDQEADALMRRRVEEQISSEQTAAANSSRGYDDGIIDPRDTRSVLGMALSACHGPPVAGADGFGVFRM